MHLNTLKTGWNLFKTNLTGKKIIDTSRLEKQLDLLKSVRNNSELT